MRIGIQDVESVSLRDGMVYVSVRYEVDCNRIDVDHIVEVGDRSMVSVVAEAVDKAIDEANAVLAGWDKAVAA